MMTRSMFLPLASAVLAGMGGAVSVAAPGPAMESTPPLAVLSAIQPGQWILKPRDGVGAIKTLCLGDPRVLLQVRHTGVPCRRFVINNDPRTAVVHYTCAGAGHGHTTLRMETPRLIQIESQGIADMEPFDVVYEGRRAGECVPLNARVTALR